MKFLKLNLKNFQICVINFALEVRMAVYYIEPYHIAMIFAILLVVRYGVELPIAWCGDNGEELKNLGEKLKDLSVDSDVKTPKMEDTTDASQKDSSSTTPPSGKNIALTDADFSSENLTAEEQAIGTDTGLDEKGKTRLKLELDARAEADAEAEKLSRELARLNSLPKPTFPDIRNPDGSFKRF